MRIDEHDIAVAAKPSTYVHLSELEVCSEDAQDSEAFVFDKAAESRLTRKLDFNIMTLLAFAFFALQLDRSNISNALTASFAKDIGITSDEASHGNMLQSAAIVACEIPSNYILQWMGPSKWLIMQSICWGCVGVFQCFVKNKSSYYATRWLLGMFEAGYIPGALFYISTFYKREELASRTAVFYFGNYVATGVGSLMAAAILRHFATSSWGSWRYLFLIEGCFSFCAAILMALFLPTEVGNTKPIHRMFDRFNLEEHELIIRRLAKEDNTKNHGAIFDISGKKFLQALLVWRNWAHCVNNILNLTPKAALQLFNPLIIKSLGFSTFKANALNSVSSFGACFLSFFCSFLSDKFHQRGLFIIISTLWSIIFAGVMMSMTIGVTSKWTLYAILMLLTAGNSSAQGINDSWVSSNSRTFENRSVGLALAVAGSNIGGIIGPNFFSSKDAPKYKPAYLAILLFYCASMVLSIGLIFAYWLLNKRLDKKEKEKENSDFQDSADWRYQL